jgi:hypothetical protein
MKCYRKVAILACLFSLGLSSPVRAQDLVGGASLAWWTEIDTSAGTGLGEADSFQANASLAVVPAAGQQQPSEYTCVAWAVEGAVAALSNTRSIPHELVERTYDAAAEHGPPRSEQIGVEAALVAARERGGSPIAGWVRLGRNVSSSSRVLREIASALTQGQPVILAIPIDATFLGMTASSPPYPGCQRQAPGDCRDYHALLVTGIDSARGVMTALNSYGPSWGRDGLIELAFSVISNEIQAVAVLDARHVQQFSVPTAACTSADVNIQGASLTLSPLQWTTDSLPVVQGLGQVTAPIQFYGPHRWSIEVDVVEPGGSVRIVESAHACGGARVDCSYSADVTFDVTATTFVVRVVTAHQINQQTVTAVFNCVASVPAPPIAR